MGAPSLTIHAVSHLLGATAVFNLTTSERTCCENNPRHCCSLLRCKLGKYVICLVGKYTTMTFTSRELKKPVSCRDFSWSRHYPGDEGYIDTKVVPGKAWAII